MEFGLILIDIQKGLDELDYYGGQRNNPEAETNCKALLEAFRGYNYPCIFIQHDSTNPASPLFPNKPGHELKKEITPLPDEPVFHKNVNSAFIGTSLEEWIKERESSIVPNYGYFKYNEYEARSFWGSSRKLNKIISK